ncbi:MAG: hypothetical protein JO051_17510 [Acidobacteriaceae bacterium]|nr:hypothetical protein [Acidobacteriaceae bacterium]
MLQALQENDGIASGYSGLGQIESGQQDMLGVKTRIGILGVLKTADKEAAADKRNDRQRQFSSHQDAMERSGTTIGRCGSAGGLERIPDVAPEYLG